MSSRLDELRAQALRRAQDQQDEANARHAELFRPAFEFAELHLDAWIEIIDLMVTEDLRYVGMEHQTVATGFLGLRLRDCWVPYLQSTAALRVSEMVDGILTDDVLEALNVEHVHAWSDPNDGVTVSHGYSSYAQKVSGLLGQPFRIVLQNLHHLSIYSRP